MALEVREILFPCRRHAVIGFGHRETFQSHRARGTANHAAVENFGSAVEILRADCSAGEIGCDAGVRAVGFFFRAMAVCGTEATRFQVLFAVFSVAGPMKLSVVVIWMPDWLANWTFQTVKAGGALVVAEAETEAVVANLTKPAEMAVPSV